VIIGGLMQKSKLQSDSKIPILGDIPLLGNLFKHKTKTDTKTELIIFLTPHIVMAPSQLAALSDRKRSKAALMPKAFTEQELNKFTDQWPVRPAPPPGKQTAPPNPPRK